MHRTAFLAEFRWGKQNGWRFRGNFVWTSKTSRVFVEIPFRRVKRLAFLQKFRLDKQNAAHFHRNSDWTNKTARVFAEIPFGRAKRRAFLWKFRLGDQNAARFYRNSAWTAKTSCRVARNFPNRTTLRIILQIFVFCYTFPMLLDELRAIIAARNLKQKDICAALNLSQSYTSELLSGKKEFSLNLLEKLCDFLQVDIKLVDKYR